MKRYYHHRNLFLTDSRWRSATLGSLYSLSLSAALFSPSLSADISSLKTQPTAYSPETTTFTGTDNSPPVCDKNTDKPRSNTPTACVPAKELNSHLSQSFLAGLASGSGISPWLLIGGAGAGLAAAASGGSGGGGGSGSSSPSSTTDLYNNDFPQTDPAHYATPEYNNRSDLETINAKEAYANIASYITGESEGTGSSGNRCHSRR